MLQELLAFVCKYLQDFASPETARVRGILWNLVALCALCASGEWEKERHEWMTMEGYGVEYSGMNGS